MAPKCPNGPPWGVRWGWDVRGLTSVRRHILECRLVYSTISRHAIRQQVRE